MLDLCWPKNLEQFEKNRKFATMYFEKGIENP